MPRYYELMDNRRTHTRWHLGGPLDTQGQEIDPWQFREGRVLKFDGLLTFPVDVSGEPLDFCWAAFAIPVVHHRFMQLLQSLQVQGVQFIPVQVEGHPGPYFILNALHVLRCIDEARSSEVQHWRAEDNQPEKIGEYRYVHGMRIDPSKVGDARIFRTWGWRIALVVSDDLRRAIEDSGLTGARFVEV